MVLRDGSNSSLWQQTEPFHPRQFTSTKEFDVVIVGGGITGVSTGLLLQKAGKRCLILEARSLGFGTTGGTTAHLNTLLDTPYNKIIHNFNLDTARQVKLATEEALQLIRSNIAQYKIACEYEDASAYLFASNAEQDQELQDILKACQEVQLPTTLTERLPINVQFVSAIETKGQGKFHPLLYLYGIAREFEKSGGVILQETRFVNAIKDKKGLLISTDNGSFLSGHLVYATHIPPGINLLHLRCVPWRSYAVAVRLHENYPDDLVYDMFDPYHYYRTQYINDIPYLIVGGEDHKTGHESNTDSCFMKLIQHVRSLFKVSDIPYQWSSQYFEPTDGLPYIGNLPGADERIYVATGFGGNGMTYSQVASQVITSLIVENVSLYQNVFQPSRVKPIAGFQEFIKHNADVAKQFVLKAIPHEKLLYLAELAPGEGRVVKFEGQSIAMSKDLEGNIHAVSPICVHMKCTVGWNQTEQSWDCPCHGARYSADGKLLTGPAVADLEAIELRSPVDK